VTDVSIQIQQEIPVRLWQEIAAEAEVTIAKLIEESTARHLADFKYDNALRAAKMDIAIPHKLTQDALRDLYRSAVQNAWRGLDADCFNSYNQGLVSKTF